VDVAGVWDDLRRLRGSEAPHADPIRRNDRGGHRSCHALDAVDLGEDRRGDRGEVRPLDVGEHVPFTDDGNRFANAVLRGKVREDRSHRPGIDAEVDVGLHVSAG
jgi:hypothetical protein